MLQRKREEKKKRKRKDIDIINDNDDIIAQLLADMKNAADVSSKIYCRNTSVLTKKQTALARNVKQFL